MKNSILILCILILVSCKDAKKEIQDPIPQKESEQKVMVSDPEKKKPLSHKLKGLIIISEYYLLFFSLLFAITFNSSQQHPLKFFISNI